MQNKFLSGSTLNLKFIRNFFKSFFAVLTKSWYSSCKLGFMYRHLQQLQLLSTLYNEIQQKMILAPLILVVTLINAFNLATVAHIHFVPGNWIITFVLSSTCIDTTAIT